MDIVSELLITVPVFFIYGTVCVLCLVLTFSKDIYLKIEAFVDRGLFFRSQRVSFLEANISGLNNWLLERHRVVGPVLVLSSLWDIKLFIWLFNR